MGKHKIKDFVNIIALTIFLTVLMMASNSFAANYPLEIIQPQPNLNTKNRYYKAFPGLDYNVRLAVIGGAYPFTYSLTSAPTGMTINSSTGVIDWPNAVTSGSPFTVTAKVTDQEGISASVTWTITVTTSGFIFIDAVNGHPSAVNGGTGTGTISNPFQTMNDWYAGTTGGTSSATKYDATYSGYFVYYRAGTYYINTYMETDYSKGRSPGGANKPLVFLAYPGESVIFDFQGNSIIHYDFVPDVYYDGFTITNMFNYGIQITGGDDRAVIRRVNFQNLGPSTDPFNINQSMIRVLAEYTAGCTNCAFAKYVTIQDCTFNNLNHGAAIKLYQLTKLLIEDNIFSNFTDTVGGALEGVALKQDLVQPTVRHNTIYNVPSEGIGGNMSGYSFNYEILFNNVYNASSNALFINQNSQLGVINVYRNTFQSTVVVLNTINGNGPFNFYNNVIVNNDNVPNHISCGGGGNGCQLPSEIIANNNLSGSTSANIVDFQGNLTSGYSSYLGTIGFQINGQMPSPPTAVTVK